MNQNGQQQGLNIDFKSTTAIEGFDGGHLFGQAFVLRKVSKFVVGGKEDALLPIPVLDGGHLLYYSLEVVRGKPLSQKTQEIGMQIGMSLLIALMIFVTFLDISRL